MLELKYLNRILGLFFLFISLTALATQQQVKVSELPSICSIVQGFRVLNNAHEADLFQVKNILAICDKTQGPSLNLSMLHGLYERKLHHYKEAIIWFKKAIALAPPENLNPKFELAVTYEWNKQAAMALQIYEELLTQNKQNRIALLGKGRVLVALSQWNNAAEIYQSLLKNNAKDVDALNGFAMLMLAEKRFSEAELFLDKALKLSPHNPDTLAELKLLKQARLAIASTPPIQAPPLCPYDEGFKLLNEAPIKLKKIYSILRVCDLEARDLDQVLLLHGLLERKLRHYPQAIEWLIRAVDKSVNSKPNILYELAITYEWNHQFAQALAIYHQLLCRHLKVRDALLGKARVMRAQYKFKNSQYIYDSLLLKNSKDVDAINGLGWIALSNYQRRKAINFFSKARSIQLSNKESQEGFALLEKQTKYMVRYLGGYYQSDGMSSFGNNISLSEHLDATHTLNFFGIYNTAEIASSFIYLPTLLPKYSAGIGLQENIPDQYSWGVAYQYLGYTNFSTQNWVSINGSLNLLPNIQTFGGAQDGFPTPWDNQFYYAGLTYISPYPVNLTFTTFYSTQDLDHFIEQALMLNPNLNAFNPFIKTLAFSFDLSKEFSDRSFYNVGTSYSPTIPTWEVHGRFIYPTFKNQALEAIGSYYFFNKSVFLNLGWRWYM